MQKPLFQGALRAFRYTTNYMVQMSLIGANVIIFSEFQQKNVRVLI